MRTHGPHTARNRFVAAVLIVAACGIAAGRIAWAQDSATPRGKVSAGDPGLSVLFESADGQSRDARIARLFALRVDPDRSPSGFLPPGRFVATYEGVLNLKFRETYSFSATGSGGVTVSVDDQVVLEGTADDLSTLTGQSIRLRKGATPVRVRYTSNADGSAALQLLWAEEGKPAEPIPSLVLGHEPAASATADFSAARTGRTLVASLRCIACHIPSSPPGSGAMPELVADSPSLNDIASRIDPAWIADWIRDPHAIRPDTPMPRVRPPDGTESDAANDIAAYLTSLAASPAIAAAAAGRDSPEPVADHAQRVGRGGDLFVGLRCIACHTTPDNPQPPAPPRVGLSHVAAKYSVESLDAYLRSPAAHFAWTRMPDFALTEIESAALSAFLISAAVGPASPAIASADPNRGRELLLSSGCLNCHSLDGHQSTLIAKPLEQVLTTAPAGGCLVVTANAPTDGASLTPSTGSPAPDFAFTADQAASIAAWASTGTASLFRDDPADAAERQIQQLNCLACHARDAQRDGLVALTTEIDIAQAAWPPLPPDPDEPPYAPDQTLPNLTWAGEKLRVTWMTQLFEGKLSYKVRPWIRARMPAFASRSRLLAEGLAAQHAMPAASEPVAMPDPQAAEIGFQLAGRQGGFSCGQCHAIASQPAIASFEAPAPNFVHVAERINHPFYRRWVRAPLRVDPLTRMPQFADPEGKTAISDAYAGDAEKQFEALWQYLLKADAITPPP